MSLQYLHDPPGHLSDLDHIGDGRGQWHRYISRLLATATSGVAAAALPSAAAQAPLPRFVDLGQHDPGLPRVQVPVVWNAFPRRLVCRFGRAKALAVADMLWPADAREDFDPLAVRWRDVTARAQRWMRPQDEYCEWRVERDPLTQGIRRVVFTVEPPEYWTALHGGALPPLPGGQPFPFVGDPQLAAARYSDLLGQTVTAAELQKPAGAYDTLNRWNTTHGIVHLTHPINALATSIGHLADSTLCVRGRDGRLVTDPQALVSAMDAGDPNTNSDPAIAGTVNALVRRGAWVALANPVGVCIDDVDISGWAWAAPAPPGTGLPDLRACLRCVRGATGRVLRLVVEAPDGSGLQLSQLTIGGEPLLHGGQIAECITLRTVVICMLPDAVPPALEQTPQRQARLRDANRQLLLVRPPAEVWLPGDIPALASP